MTIEKNMKYTSEIDRKLTMQCDFSFQWKDPILEASRRLEESAVGFLLYGEEKMEVIYYFPLNADKSSEGKRSLTLMGAKKTKDLWSVRGEINEPFVKDAINLILSKPSVTIDMISLKEGLMRMRIRFHADLTNSVSEALLSGIKASEGFSIDYFGKSRGLLETLNEISALVPLAGIEFTMRPKQSIFSESTEVFSKPWIRIRKYDSGDFKLHHIYHFSQEVENEDRYELVTISRGDHLYEAYTVNPVIKYMVSEAEKLNIFNDSIHRYDGNVVTGRIWLPSTFVPDYMKILGQARIKYPEWGIGIQMAASIDDIFTMSGENFTDNGIGEGSTEGKGPDL
ncbi:MAG: hypothetical protein M1301_05655 [Candidatus Thermoplasmatota archaeon]|jgi:hypothetical protein|nr:hypothetical protein [Candidatus Thermoplasmatota archaeon]